MGGARRLTSHDLAYHEQLLREQEQTQHYLEGRLSSWLGYLAHRYGLDARDVVVRSGEITRLEPPVAAELLESPEQVS